MPRHERCEPSTGHGLGNTLRPGIRVPPCALITKMNTKPPSNRQEFELNLLTFLNHVLPGLDRQNRSYPPIEADTLLFETGIVDSLSILHLIGFLEHQTRRPIPDKMILPPNFRSPEAIVRAFWPASHYENDIA